jgi:hypothetical protein
MDSWIAPPEFGPDGSPPPIRTEPIQFDVTYIAREAGHYYAEIYPANDLLHYEEALPPDKAEARQWLSAAGGEVAVAAGGGCAGGVQQNRWRAAGRPGWSKAP